MKAGIPSWLLKSYWKLLSDFGFLPFTIEQARAALGRKAPVSVILYKLRERGWASKYEGSRNRLVHPMIAMMESTGESWKKIRDEHRLPITELAVARMIEELGPRLKSVIIFGSVARNRAREESDIDIFVVSEGLSGEYSGRVRLFNSLVRTEGIRGWTRLLWEEKKIYPLIDIIPVTPEEVAITHPFYLDMAEEAIIVFDRQQFMQKRLEKLRRYLAKAGARKVSVPDGSYYWLMPQVSSRKSLS